VSTSTLPPGAQFGRIARLIVSGVNSAIDLSQLRFTFNIYASDTESPNNATIRVYNLKTETLNTIVNEYTSVALDAGYGSNVANIFKGDIKQFRRGKEDNVTTFLEIAAADGDELYNFGTLNLTLAQQTTLAQRYEAICNQLGAVKDPNSTAFLQSTGGIDPKGKTYFGMFRAAMREIANTAACRWSIQGGKIVLIPLTGFLPGTPIPINSTTGMIGVPEDTDNGIIINNLLNPLFQPGLRVQLNSADIPEWIIKQQGYPNYKDNSTFAAGVEQGLGVYRIMVVEHHGDTRGLPWYSELTCLDLDITASNTGQSVKAYGG
jgi:hypothetical protein